MLYPSTVRLANPLDGIHPSFGKLGRDVGENFMAETLACPKTGKSPMH